MLAGCSGAEGERAQQLLGRAQTAQSRLTSMGYDLRMTFALDGQRASLVLDGGAYLKGRRAGDQLMTMRMEGLPDLTAMNMRLLLRGRRLTMTANGRTFSSTVPASARRQYDWSSTMLDLTRYVKDVRVRENRVVNGERGATVSGVIDTEGLLEAASKLRSFSQATGQAAPDLSSLGAEVGDTHAALFVSNRTGLIRSAVVSVGMKAAGKRFDLDVTYRLKHVNRAIPGL